jgi:signal transduction histidine kinase
MDGSAWSAQQLAEFVASVSPCTTEATAARVTVERAAEALDADVAAIVCGGQLLAAVGYPEGTEPISELTRVAPGAPDAWLNVPGAGWCAAAAATLAYPPGATLILARPTALTRQETGLLRGMARIAAMTMRMLSVLDHERAAREEVERLAREQAALRRVATLVARGATPDEVFASVAQEVGHVLPDADFTTVGRYDPGPVVEVVGGWSGAGNHTLVGRRWSLGGQNVNTLVFERNGPARIDHHLTDGADPVSAAARELGMRSSAGAPISVEGRPWGMIGVASTRENALPPGTEYRLAEFTELIATTIANTQARQEVSALAEEQAALRRVATLVARGEPPKVVFDAVTQEVGQLLLADATVLCRYDSDDYVARVGVWSKSPDPLPDGDRVRLGGRNVSALVFETGRAARIDNFGADSGPGTAVWVSAGLRSAAGAPISVEGRLWGLVVVMSTSDEPLAADTEARLAGFADLVATAIANAEAQAELKASRARIVATADQTRRRIERDLHDGAQQRLVTLALQLRAAQEQVPPQFDRLSADLGRVVAGLASTLDELREYARGIHPAILAKGGLEPALKMLARRSSIPVNLDVRIGKRLSENIEVTAYYVISEALTNAAKHAEASSVEVEAGTTSGTLRLDVSDDGVGGADPARGSGLIGLKDRVEATGGTFTVRSRPGEGTRLRIELPIRLPGTLR